MRLTGLAVVTPALPRATSMQRKRAALTVAAIAWGTVAILLLLSFGEGLKRQMMNEPAGMGENIAVCGRARPPRPGRGCPTGRPIRPSVDDIAYLAGAHDRGVGRHRRDARLVQRP